MNPLLPTVKSFSTENRFKKIFDHLKVEGKLAVEEKGMGTLSTNALDMKAFYERYKNMKQWKNIKLVSLYSMSRKIYLENHTKISRLDGILQLNHNSVRELCKSESIAFKDTIKPKPISYSAFIGTVYYDSKKGNKGYYFVFADNVRL